ncbi:MAG: hypothetical protein HOP08_16490 [Cyclobacteriaceae bacterium]|nr:hypothetical protein [Cyclobacteriaceae bacterium]
MKESRIVRLMLGLIAAVVIIALIVLDFKDKKPSAFGSSDIITIQKHARHLSSVAISVFHAMKNN